MSGHSKWATIKRKKSANDAARGALTTKISREITTAVKMGGADSALNMRLKLALSKARANNVTKDNINRAIQKGLGSSDTSNFEEISYEGYAQGGVAVLLSCLTDNRNRTAANIRHIFSKNGGSLAEKGSVSWLFSQKATFTVAQEAVDEEKLLELAFDAGADDLNEEDESFIITADTSAFNQLESALAEAGIEALGEISQVPSTTVELSDEDEEKLAALVEALEDDDDVQEVFTNAK